MTDAEFSDALGKALGVCRAAAGLKLPVEAMLEHVEDAIAAVAESVRAGTDGATPPLRSGGELVALRIILSAVGEVAAIGASLPPEEKPAEPPPCPLPANLLTGCT